MLNHKGTEGKEFGTSGKVVNLMNPNLTTSKSYKLATECLYTCRCVTEWPEPGSHLSRDFTSCNALVLNPIVLLFLDLS